MGCSVAGDASVSATTAQPAPAEAPASDPTGASKALTPSHSEPASDVDECDSDYSEDDSARVWGAFMKAHANFDNDLKWRLPSGNTVEDTLYDAVLTGRSLTKPVESLVKTWVVDVDCSYTRSLFSVSDWEAIRAEVPPLPVANEEFGNFLSRFEQVWFDLARAVKCLFRLLSDESPDQRCRVSRSCPVHKASVR
jgi:hypothetical protein